MFISFPALQTLSSVYNPSYADSHSQNKFCDVNQTLCSPFILPLLSYIAVLPSISQKDNFLFERVSLSQIYFVFGRDDFDRKRKMVDMVSVVVNGPEFRQFFS